MEVTVDEIGDLHYGIPNVGDVLINKWGEKWLVDAVGEKSYIVKNITPWHHRIMCRIRLLVRCWRAWWIGE